MVKISVVRALISSAFLLFWIDSVSIFCISSNIVMVDSFPFSALCSFLSARIWDSLAKEEPSVAFCAISEMVSPICTAEVLMETVVAEISSILAASSSIEEEVSLALWFELVTKVEISVAEFIMLPDS